jgi:hypothetical protein
MKTKKVGVLFCRLKIDVRSSAFCAGSQSFIGINYGQVADNLPPPSSTAKLLQSTSIKRSDYMELELELLSVLQMVTFRD